MNVTYSSHFDEMCQFCPYIDVTVDVEHTKDPLDANILHVNVYCKNIEHCENVFRRAKEHAKKQMI